MSRVPTGSESRVGRNGREREERWNVSWPGILGGGRKGRVALAVRTLGRAPLNSLFGCPFPRPGSLSDLKSAPSSAGGHWGSSAGLVARVTCSPFSKESAPGRVRRFSDEVSWHPALSRCRRPGPRASYFTRSDSTSTVQYGEIMRIAIETMYDGM